MGNLHSIAKSNDFWVKNLNDFKEGLEGFVGGEEESEVEYSYSDYKKGSEKALINISSDCFISDLWHRENPDDIQDIDFLEYIQSHLVEGEEVILHWICYEYVNDMSINRLRVTPEHIENTFLLK